MLGWKEGTIGKMKVEEMNCLPEPENTLTMTAECGRRSLAKQINIPKAQNAT